MATADFRRNSLILWISSTGHEHVHEMFPALHVANSRLEIVLILVTSSMQLFIVCAFGQLH